MMVAMDIALVFLGAVAGTAVVTALVARRPGAPAGPQVLAQRVDSLHHQLSHVGELVAGLGRERAEQHGQVIAGLAEAGRATAALADTTQRLREALASPKARGQWGERMADDVLRLAGFVEGLNYRRQTAITGGRVPDVTFFLPGDLLLHMDVKFPIDNYLRSLDAVTQAERLAAERAFIGDVRARIRDLGGRGYIQPGVTVDHVLLFIPNETVYSFVLAHDPHLIDVALQQRVVVCSPFTLFAVLAVIRQAVDTVELRRVSDEILVCLGAFSEQWQRFGDAIDLVGQRLDRAQRAFDDLAGPRRRQLQARLDRIDAVRAEPAPVAAESNGRSPPAHP